MATVVINWEGRGYEDESFEADLRAASKIIDFKAPLWHGAYDAGLLLTDNPDERVATGLRHGHASEMILEKEYYDSDLWITENWLKSHYEIYAGSEDQSSLGTQEVVRIIAEELGISLLKKED